MSKNHNHRQRKKLHIGEYKELGFNLEITLNDGVSGLAEAAVLEAFIEFIETRRLMCGGSLSFAFVCRDSRGDASEDDRAAVREWLSARPEVAAVVVGELADAWR